MLKRGLGVAVVLGAILMVGSGCEGLSVKDTGGIKLYLSDQSAAEIRALAMKTAYRDKTSQAYKTAEKLYNQADADGTGWVSGILLDAKMKHEVNVSESQYKNSPAGKSLAAFLALEVTVEKMEGDPVAIANAAAVFIGEIAKIVYDQNKVRLQEAIQALEGALQKARWTTFDQLTVQWVEEKHKTVAAKP
jgi:hypothetical protein